MEGSYGKKYVLVHSENFEDFLVFIGVGYIARKVAISLKQTVCLTRNEDGSYKFEFISPITTDHFTFKPGETFEEVRPDGEKLISVATVEGNTMTHTQIHPTGGKCTHVREFFGDKMVTTTTGPGLARTVKRFYESR